MGMQVLEGLFAVAIVGLVLTNSTGFSQAVRAFGSAYVYAVQGLGGFTK